MKHPHCQFDSGGVIYFSLPIALRSVVSLAQHLAVFDVGLATLAPGRNMVGIHLGNFPDALAVALVTQGA